MSEALDYLLKARPEAMQAYFSFLREAGRGLDPKTRALISVITKVDKQTPAGFRQYLKRALAEGATATEVLDALLMAFPTLGLTKILWAVDQIQQLDVPAFRLENLNVPTWHDVLAAADMPSGVTVHVEHDGRGLFLHNGAQGICVFDSRCPHRATTIPAAGISAGAITCPKHKWNFDPATGACTSGGEGALRRMDHKIEAGRVFVFW
jgi:nitrite reductase/ring-hydroxylating ferredoxin subunit/alkylhydroperoxidase/carboxymuconolactone decarboxylase family protein YurZ